MTHENEKGRPVAAGRHLPFCQLGGDDSGDNTEALRRQFLCRGLGLSQVRADLVASLAWGALA